MTMDRAIFDLKASVEATSLYILICALMDQGETPSINRARIQWSGGDTTLLKGVEELIRLGVLESMSLLDEDKPLQVNPSEKWAGKSEER